MRTTKRQYTFLADSVELAQKWIDTIHTRITG